MSKLRQYAEKASFMNIAIELDGKVFKFNLDEELIVKETKLNLEVKEQPRNYAFLAMLRTKIKVKIKDQYKALKRKEAELYNKYKDELNTDKVTHINAKVKEDKSLRKLQDTIDHTEHLKDVLDVAVESFMQRKDLLQTLSSNIRKENNN